MASKKRRQRSSDVRTSAGPAATGSGCRWAGTVATTALTLVTVAAFWRVFENGFVYDDEGYVTRNPFVQQGITLRSIVWAFTAFYQANWHPLTWISHMLDWRLFGQNAMGHHLVNLAFHAANVLLLFWALARMTGAVWKSAFAAALFAVHPLHVESVAWVAERKDVLSAFFWLLTMLAYARYAERPRFRRYFLVVLLFGLGLLTKPMLVSLPIVLLLLDYWPLARLRAGCGLRSWRPLLLEKLPLFALSAASCVVTLMAQRAAGALARFEDYPLLTRVANAFASYAKYVIKTFWPSRLAVLYPGREEAALFPGAAALVFLVVASALFLRGGRSRGYLMLGWLWYLITLIPVIGIVQVGSQAMADRYTYMPLVGIFIILAWGIPDAADFAARGRYKISVVRKALPGLACAVILVLTLATNVQVGYWHSNMTLWQRAIDAAGESPQACYNLGQGLQEHGEIERARLMYARAVELAPDYAQARNNLGTVLQDMGKPEEAAREFREVIRLEPRNAAGYINLGNVLSDQGKLDEALRQYFLAVKVSPDYPIAHYSAGNILARQERYAEAERRFREAIRLRPNFALAHNNLAMVLYRLGDYAGARGHVRLCAEYGGTPLPELVSALSEKAGRAAE